VGTVTLFVGTEARSEALGFEGFSELLRALQVAMTWRSRARRRPRARITATERNRRSDVHMANSWYSSMEAATELTEESVEVCMHFRYSAGDSNGGRRDRSGDSSRECPRRPSHGDGRADWREETGFQLNRYPIASQSDGALAGETTNLPWRARSPHGKRLFRHPFQRFRQQAFWEGDREQPHQSLGNRPLADVGQSEPDALPFPERGVFCEKRLGGLLRHYRRAA